jgi:hypothetical protein
MKNKLIHQCVVAGLVGAMLAACGGSNDTPAASGPPTGGDSDGTGGTGGGGGTGPLHSTRLAGAGLMASGLALYGCDTGTAPGGWSMRYVAPGGAGAGTKASPHPSITDAWNATGTGGKVVLCVAAGNYVETLNFGTNRSVVLAGGFAATFTTRAPATTPSKLQPAPGAAAVDAIAAASPVSLTIDGMEVTSSQRRGINITLWDTANESVVLRNNHVHHNGSTVNFGASATGGISIGGGGRPAVVVANNVLEFNLGWHHGGGLDIGGGAETVNPIVRGTLNDGFGSMGTQATGLATVSYNIIRNNRVHEPTLPHGGGASISMNAIVDHNEFFENDTYAAGNGFGVGGGLIAQHGTSNDHSMALISVQNNWFEGNRGGKAGAAVFLDQTHAGYVINNVIVRNVGPGAVLVDGACSNSCAGTGGNNDRNFISIVSNTIVGNTGAGVALQDATAALYFNVIWNNAGDDIQLMNGSVGAENIVRGAHNIISSNYPALSNTINGAALPGVVNAQYRLVSDMVGAVPASAPGGAFLPAFQFTGAMARSFVLEQDLLAQPRLRADGRYLYGAFATVGQ